MLYFARSVLTIATLLFLSVVGFTEPLPASAFSHLPTASDIELSPSGRYLAYLQNLDGGTVLATLDIKTNKVNEIVMTDNERFKFRWLEWVNDDQFIVSVIYPDYRGLGVATSETRLFAASPHSKEFKVMVKPRRRGAHIQHFSQFQDSVVSMLPNEKNHILIELDLESQNFPGVYKVDIKEGGKEIVKSSRSPIRSWTADRQGRVRAGRGYKAQDGTQSIWVHSLEKDKWKKVWEFKTFEQPDISILGFGKDPSKLYIRADYQGRNAIYSIDTESTSYEKTLIEADPNYDINGGLIFSPKLNDVVGVYHSAVSGGRIYWDEGYASFQGALDKALPDTNNQLVSFSDDERKYILYTSDDSQPGTYYYGDRDTGALSPFIYQYPQLQDQTLSTKRKIVYKSRDGLEIEGFLSLPPGATKKPLPAVIHPHGGPMGRDYGGFDYWTQFFTSRGYAVLQPNFRGSSGYGHDFMMQAVKGYGLAMQDDLEDATQWLIDQGIADQQRICIVGASYGGYAAMMAAVKTPDLYRCAISFAGMSDLLEQRNHYRNYVNRAVAFDQFGSDSQQLKATSPRRHVEKIKIPLLLIHGEKDRVVPVRQSREMAEELEDNDKDFIYLELENGTHHLSRQENRVSLFDAMDKFLAKHLSTDL